MTGANIAVRKMVEYNLAFKLVPKYLQLLLLDNYQTLYKNLQIYAVGKTRREGV